MSSTNHYLESLPFLSHSIYTVLILIIILIFFFIFFKLKNNQSKKNYEKLQKEREQESKARQEFIANINHEIRTPVNVIGGMLNLLLKQSINEQAKKYIEKIKLANNDIKNVIDDALDFDKFYTGQIQAKSKIINLKDFCEYLEDAFTLAAKQKNLNLSFNIDSQIPPAFKTDEYLLGSICQKLLNNAIKFTDSGSVYFNVSLVAKNEEQRRFSIKFEIIDTGIGIKQEKIHEVFDAFRQIDGSSTRAHAGLGVGLFLTRHMLKALGTHISIETTWGKGSNFHFILDVEQASEQEADDSPICEGKKIMFVDDDVIIQKIGDSLLTDLQCQPTILSSGPEALAKIDETFDLLILDVKMPDMDGTEVASKIREKGLSNIPIIALTADTEEEDIKRYKASGMNYCIPKPIDANKLKETISSLLKDKNLDSQAFIEAEKATIAKSKKIVVDVNKEVFDPEQGLRLINNDQSLFNSILAKFKENFKNSDEKILKLMVDKDFKGATLLAHSV